MSAHNGTFNKLKIANKKAKEEFKKFKASAVTLDLSCSELNYELEYLKNMLFVHFSEVLLEDIFDVETGVKTFIVMHTPERLSSILNLFLQRTLKDSEFKSSIKLLITELDEASRLQIYDKPFTTNKFSLNLTAKEA